MPGRPATSHCGGTGRGRSRAPSPVSKPTNGSAIGSRYRTDRGRRGGAGVSKRPLRRRETDGCECPASSAGAPAAPEPAARSATVCRSAAPPAQPRARRLPNAAAAGRNSSRAGFIAATATSAPRSPGEATQAGAPLGHTSFLGLAKGAFCLHDGGLVVHLAQSGAVEQANLAIRM